MIKDKPVFVFLWQEKGGEGGCFLDFYRDVNYRIDNGLPQGFFLDNMRGYM